MMMIPVGQRSPAMEGHQQLHRREEGVGMVTGSTLVFAAARSFQDTQRIERKRGEAGLG